MPDRCTDALITPHLEYTDLARADGPPLTMFPKARSARRGSTLHLVVIALVGVGLVRGQTTNTSCVSNGTTDWLFNPAGESPCLIWSKIQSLCLPSSGYLNVPPLLDATWGYNPPPSPGTICQCNAVSYGLMAGCTWCQLGDGGKWAKEGDWKAGCANYSGDGLGFGESVEGIPAYAWKPWNGDSWNASIASAAASSYTSSPTTSYTTTLSRSFPAISTTQNTAKPTPPPSSNSTASSPSSSSASDASSSASGGGNGKKYGAIVGGIAGATFLLILLFFLFRHLRSRQTRAQSQSQKNRTLPRDRMAKNPYADAGRSDSPPSFFDTMDPSATMDKRGTELIADPRSFSAPRPAPRAPSRYTITSRRSGASNYTPGMESRASMDSRMITPHRPPGLEVLESTEDEYEESETQDFSRPSKDFSRPYSSADMRTLPSLYDPPTGAERYTATSEMISPRSRYPPSERGRESVGAALGSGVGAGGRVRDLKRESEERYYARMDMPALPRGVSDESR